MTRRMNPTHPLSDKAWTSVTMPPARSLGLASYLELWVIFIPPGE